MHSNGGRDATRRTLSEGLSFADRIVVPFHHHATRRDAFYRMIVNYIVS
jgi:hypothetical protein